MCVYFHKNCNKISIFKFLAYRVYEGYDKAVEDETSHTYVILLSVYFTYGIYCTVMIVFIYASIYTYICVVTGFGLDSDSDRGIYVIYLVIYLHIYIHIRVILLFIYVLYA